MTSRVQKGGPIFRPVAKFRTRTPAGDNRQPSIPADGPSDSRHVETPAPSQGAMPPPAFVPNRATPVPHPNEPFDEATTQQALNILYASTVPQLRSDPLASSLLPGRPPTLAITNSQDTPNRNSTPPPPTVTDRAPPSLISLGVLSPLLSSSPAIPMPVSSAPDLVNGDGPSIPPPYTYVLNHSGAENVPKLALDTSGVVIKPQRAASKKKTSIPVLFDGHQQEDPNHEQSEKPIEKKVKRKRNSKSDGSEPVKTRPKRKKKNVVTSDPEGSDNETNDTPANKRKRRSSSGTPRPRRSRAPSLLPFDPDADPGEEIDPTVVTMASLCVDTGQGRVSRKAAEILSNHAAWKAQNREKRVRMKALMELKKYGREEDGAAKETSPVDKEAQDVAIPGSSNGVAQTENAPVVDDTGSGFDYSQDMATSRFNVQVRIGPNGETIIDEESLVVDRTEADDTENYTHVVESDHTKFVNSGSYGRKFRGSRWSAEETESFYDALSQYGENYELIAYVLPGRDRKSCKNKFKAEDKKNPARINYCLTNSIPVDMTTLSRMTGKDFSGPVPEIRAPTPQIEFDPAHTEAQKSSPPEVTQKKRRGKKKTSGDDGAVVVGDAGTFVPFPESP